MAPEIEGEDEFGNTMRLSDFRGKVVLLEFWMTACPACELFHQHGWLLVRRYENKPVVIVGVNVDPQLRIMKETLQARPHPWRTWWDGTERSAFNAYQVVSVPTLFLIDREGKIQKQYPGYSGSLDTLEHDIDALLQSSGD